MEALLSAMSGLAVDGAFPCMPYVAYASMRNMDFRRHVPEQGEVVIESQSWVLPDFTLADFYTVPKDFCAAAFVFLGSIPQCKQSVLSLQSVPSTTDLQRSMAPDRHTAFLTKLAAWLATRGIWRRQACAGPVTSAAKSSEKVGVPTETATAVPSTMGS